MADGRAQERTVQEGADWDPWPSCDLVKTGRPPVIRHQGFRGMTKRVRPSGGVVLEA